MCRLSRNTLNSFERKGVISSRIETLLFFFFRTALFRIFTLLTSIPTIFSRTGSVPLLVGLSWHMLISARLKATPALLENWMERSSAPKTWFFLVYILVNRIFLEPTSQSSILSRQVWVLYLLQVLYNVLYL